MADTDKDGKEVKAPRIRARYEEPDVCWVCKGNGVVTRRDTVDEMCEVCDGEGVIWR